jgi:hypothetical protein
MQLWLCARRVKVSSSLSRKNNNDWVGILEFPWNWTKEGNKVLACSIQTAKVDHLTGHLSFATHVCTVELKTWSGFVFSQVVYVEVMLECTILLPLRSKHDKNCVFSVVKCFHWILSEFTGLTECEEICSLFVQVLSLDFEWIHWSHWIGLSENSVNSSVELNKD